MVFYLVGMDQPATMHSGLRIFLLRPALRVWLFHPGAPIIIFMQRISKVVRSLCGTQALQRSICPSVIRAFLPAIILSISRLSAPGFLLLMPRLDLMARIRRARVMVL